MGPPARRWRPRAPPPPPPPPSPPLVLLLLLLLVSSPAVVSALSPSMLPDRYVGFDLGTSGARISVVERSSPSGGWNGGAGGDGAGVGSFREVHSDSVSWADVGSPYDDTSGWIGAVHTLLDRTMSARPDLLGSVRSMCASGTSASCVIVDADDGGAVTRPPRMYDHDVVSRSVVDDDPCPALRAMDLLKEYAPPRHTALARTGALAKLLTWQCESPLRSGEVLCHQADYVSMHLMYGPERRGAGAEANRREVTSDWHNCLKLGYDVRNLRWPGWLTRCLEEGAGIEDALAVLPSRVASPGEPIGTVSPSLAEEYGIPDDAAVVGGTTDSNAAFFAAAGTNPEPGTAVTSLGSTLAIKQLSTAFVEDADRGVYSHRFPVFGGPSSSAAEGGGEDAAEAWLIGGASNVGCAVLRQEGFTDEELMELSGLIDPSADSPLAYYPLTKRGERFPNADPDRVPVLDPKPGRRDEYLHGILQGIGDVEREGFRILGELGAVPPFPARVLTCGGGAKNEVWREMRRRRLGEICGDGDGDGGISIEVAENTEASFGAAILAAAMF